MGVPKIPATNCVLLVDPARSPAHVTLPPPPAGPWGPWGPGTPTMVEARKAVIGPAGRVILRAMLWAQGTGYDVDRRAGRRPRRGVDGGDPVPTLAGREDLGGLVGDATEHEVARAARHRAVLGYGR